MKKYTFCYGHEMRFRKEHPSLTHTMAGALDDINQSIDPENKGVESLAESIK